MPQRARRRMGIRRKLMLLSGILLAVPLLGYYYAQQMERFLLDGQKNAQLLAARALATVLHGRNDLFDMTFGLPLPLEDEHEVTAHLLPAPVRLDGERSDWGELAGEAQTYDARHVLSAVGAYDPRSVQLRLVLGLRGGFIYVFASVRDDRVLYRDARYLRLDHSDHLRLYVQDADGRLGRYAILASGPGTGSAYAMQEDWAQPETGVPEHSIRSEWRETAEGYDVELRLPERLLGRDAHLAFVVADVDDRVRRTPDTLLGTVPTPRVQALNRMLVYSDEIATILAGLDRPDARIWVVDTEQRVRAVEGSLSGVRILESEAEDTGGDPIPLREELVADAIAGREGVGRVVAPGGRGILIAAYPIWSGADPLGAVVIEQSESDVLAEERRAMDRLVLATLAVFGVVVVAYLGFATRLTLRIRELRNSADAAIDPDGRVRADHLSAGTDAGDEIGDLARGFSAMLQRLAQYTRYLELMPRALKHEMQNPINTVSTSLQNLAEEVPGTRESHYLTAADRGVHRLGAILESLTEAANLEEALQREQFTDLDLDALVAQYVDNVTDAYPARRFEYAGPEGPVPVRAAGFLIEQLLDKLIENAVDFSAEGSTIGIRLERAGREARLSVENEGPPLPDALQGHLFESMVSGRAPSQNDKPHLGMGLYVVRVIAEYHHGRVHAATRPEPEGAVITVGLPLTRAGQTVGTV